MSKKHKHRFQPPSSSSTSTTTGFTPLATIVNPTVSAPNQAEEAAALKEAAVGLEPNAPPLPAIEAAAQPDPAKIIADARSAKATFDRLKAACDERAQELDKRDLRQNEKRDELNIRDKALAEREVAVAKREGELRNEERARLDREEALKRREADAEAGFIDKRHQSLDALQKQIDELAHEAEKQITVRAESARKHEEQLRLACDQARQEMEGEIAMIRKRVADIVRREREIECREDDVSRLKESLEQRIAERVQATETQLKARLEHALSRCQELGKQIATYEEAERIAGGRSREQLLSENQALRDERDRLRTELGTRATDEQTARLQHLESETERQASDLARSRQENNELQRRLGSLMISVTEVQNLRDQKAAWESREGALKGAVEQLRAELGQLTQSANAQPPFPALSAMDKDAKLQAAVQTESSASPIADLASLAKRARHEMAQKRQDDPSFYYAESDVRCFIAGLASNKLHLLQGISGTGKSSLPREMARVLGWGQEVIEVQSGWRDRSDLLGYYNAFERKFYESKCLRALYKAQCPRHQCAPFLVVLDEMNLSHPEHYFADFLSALEQPVQMREVSVMVAPVSPTPKLLRSGALKIPDNVWFIGTANHDETTKDFADKTYDRAHVMEFPRHPNEFSPERHHPIAPVSMELLSKLFEDAQSKYATHADDSLRFLTTDLRIPLEKVGLGWGNRLEKQLRTFLPVVVAAGGTREEALDHLLATKILRKLRERYDLNLEDLKSLQKEIQTKWPGGARGTAAVKSVSLLERELKRLGQRA